MERKIKVRAVIIKDGKLLCVWHKPYNDEAVDYWCTMGGTVDVGEGLLDAVVREVEEECGITPVVGNLIFVQQYIHNGDHEQIEFFYNIENPDDFENIDLSSTSHGDLEIEKIDFIEPAKETVYPEFLQKEDWANFDPAQNVRYFSEL